VSAHTNTAVSTSSGAKMSAFAAWKLAIRLKTLPAATAPVIVGTGAAIYRGHFAPLPALAALAGALLLQIGANLANDLFDFQRGADTAERLGPLRVTQAGLLTPRQVRNGTVFVFALAMIVGVFLVAVGGWAIVCIGLGSIVVALAYTGGPFPLAYYGLGELFALLFFGLAAVGGTYFVQAGRMDAVAWLAAVPIGVLAAMILMVNNLRDIETDRAAGKHTLATRLGRRGSQIEYGILLAVVVLAPVVLWISGAATALALLAWLSLPLAVPLLRGVLREQGRALNAVLAGTARLELVYGVLLALGLIIGRAG